MGSEKYLQNRCCHDITLYPFSQALKYFKVNEKSHKEKLSPVLTGITILDIGNVSVTIFFFILMKEQEGNKTL